MLKGQKPRLVVRASLQKISIQVVEYMPTGDRIIAQATSKDLKDLGWTVANGNLPEAYLVGLLLAKKAKVKGDVVLDAGFRAKTKKVYAAVKGVIDGGLSVACSEEAFPAEDRLNGNHIAEYAKSMEKEQFEKHFSRYIKQNIDPKRLNELVENVKANIRNG